MLDESFLNTNSTAFEDFWNRRIPDARFEARYSAYGYQLHFLTNDRAVLEAAQISAARYSRDNSLDGAPEIRIRVLVIPTFPDTAVPPDLSERLQTVGVGDTLYQAATPWIQWVTDLQARTCTMMISPPLAAEPWQLSRSILDRAVLNILVREGVGQLHSTTLVRGRTALLLVAPHGTGKSTTAFHLLNWRFRLMGDGLVFVRERGGNAVSGTTEFELMGYPVGEAKLTDEAKALFPGWEGQGIEVTAHNIVKHVVNLRTLAPDKMVETSIVPERIVVCLAERHGQSATTAIRLDAETALGRLLPDSIFWDEPDAMLRSLGVLERMLEQAESYRLELGTDREQLVKTIVGLA